MSNNEEFNKIMNQNLERQKQKENWIEKKLKDVLPKEEDLKDISKVMLAHNIVCLRDELDEITDERDIISKENERLKKDNDRLSEENTNLTLLINR
tara:strand:- start:57 stop:344 length:288 start_codon:yes stop_codon:yes gene_type:complete